ncbi:hypothetical protein T484DRAFT_1791794 [Baffinella frigidus]|nr:hypothetical protein T484DRAFT_1791794 [Cryptophyta sp. CCMP2293]
MPTPATPDPAAERLRAFREYVKERDTPRAATWLASRIAERGNKLDGSKPAWFAARRGAHVQLRISIDGLRPVVWRRMRVSARLTLRELHHQVLCPAMGWSSNYHSYAFRRVPPFARPVDSMSQEERDELKRERDALDAKERERDALDAKGRDEVKRECDALDAKEGKSAAAGGKGKILDFLKDAKQLAEWSRGEMWVGPAKSTALDSRHAPFYIGGAVVDDEQITVWDVLRQKNDGVQWVSDLGDWWSHHIEVEEVRGEGGEDIGDWADPVATVVDGEGVCPPEDCNGLVGYTQIMNKLQGRTQVEDNHLNPTIPEWWTLLNSEFRSKHNAARIGLESFAEFDLSATKQQLKEGICIKTPQGHGLAGAGAKAKPPGPLEKCAECGSTTMLRACKGCRREAYCCKEHQTARWEAHKADCKAAQRELADESPAKSGAASK